MQDEINEKIVALSIRAGSQGFRVTSSVLKAAMRQYLQNQEKLKTKYSMKQAERSVPRGKQTVAQLMDQKQGLTNIEITNRNIKSFERVANKYKIDFALKKDKSVDPPRYLVFFKAKDVDVMTAAFKEFSTKELIKMNKPSIQKRLTRYKQKAKNQNKQRERTKQKERGQER